MYEWKGIVIIDNNAYLKIDKHYYINLMQEFKLLS
ncbi:hypothetical protein R7P08_12480, partial [Listeria monocytogenes]